jgi:hypothetical protein
VSADDFERRVKEYDRIAAEDYADGLRRAASSARKAAADCRAGALRLRVALP